MQPTRDEIWLCDPGHISGGGQAFAVRLARAWSARLPVPMVIVAPVDSALREMAVAAGVPVRSAPIPPFRAGSQFAIAVMTWRHLIRRARPRALLSNSARTGMVWGLARSIGHPWPQIGHIMHDIATADRLALPLLVRRSDAVFAVGAVARERYADRFPAIEVDAVPNFLLEADWPWDSAGGDGRRRGHPPSLAVIARLVPSKGILEAVDELSHVSAAWSFALIAGSGPSEYVDAVESRIRYLGLSDRIRLVGHVDPRQLLPCVDTLLVPSIGPEAQPTVLLEALIEGMPCVVRDHIASQDFAGLPVFPYRSRADLGAALAESRRIGRNQSTREAFLRRFSPDSAVRTISERLGVSA